MYKQHLNKIIKTVKLKHHTKFFRTHKRNIKKKRIGIQVVTGNSEMRTYFPFILSLHNNLGGSVAGKLYR